MKVAVIPARGGSKRIPRKNIRPFCGKPMIAWSIAAAQDSGCFDRIIVSTDDAEIASVARELGAEVPFVRPAALADDHAGTIPVIRHAVQWHAEHIGPLDMACCIYPAAPLIRPDDLVRGMALMDASDVDYVFPVAQYSSPIQRALRIDAQGRVGMFQPERFNDRTQDLAPAYHDASQFYWGRADAWRAETPIFGAGSLPIVLPAYRVQDIDTADDWIRAELLFSALCASHDRQ